MCCWVCVYRMWVSYSKNNIAARDTIDNFILKNLLNLASKCAVILGDSTNTPYSSGRIRIRTPILTFVFPFLASFVPKLSAFFRVAGFDVDFTVHGKMLLHPSGSVTSMHFVSISNQHLSQKSFALSSTQRLPSRDETFHAAPKTMLQIPLSVATRSVKKKLFRAFRKLRQLPLHQRIEKFFMSCICDIVVLNVFPRHFWPGTWEVSGNQNHRLFFYATRPNALGFATSPLNGEGFPKFVMSTPGFWRAHVVWINCPVAISAPRGLVFLEISRLEVRRGPPQVSPVARSELCVCRRQWTCWETVTRKMLRNTLEIAQQGVYDSTLVPNSSRERGTGCPKAIEALRARLEAEMRDGEQRSQTRQLARSWGVEDIPRKKKRRCDVFRNIARGLARCSWCCRAAEQIVVVPLFDFMLRLTSSPEQRFH